MRLLSDTCKEDKYPRLHEELTKILSSDLSIEDTVEALTETFFCQEPLETMDEDPGVEIYAATC